MKYLLYFISNSKDDESFNLFNILEFIEKTNHVIDFIEVFLGNLYCNFNKLTSFNV